MADDNRFHAVSCQEKAPKLTVYHIIRDTFIYQTSLFIISNVTVETASGIGYQDISWQPVGNQYIAQHKKFCDFQRHLLLFLFLRDFCRPTTPWVFFLHKTVPRCLPFAVQRQKENTPNTKTNAQQPNHQTTNLPNHFFNIFSCQPLIFVKKLLGRVKYVKADNANS